MNPARRLASAEKKHPSQAMLATMAMPLKTEKGVGTLRHVKAVNRLTKVRHLIRQLTPEPEAIAITPMRTPMAGGVGIASLVKAANPRWDSLRYLSCQPLAPVKKCDGAQPDKTTANAKSGL